MSTDVLGWTSPCLFGWVGWMGIIAMGPIASWRPGGACASAAAAHISISLAHTPNANPRIRTPWISTRPIGQPIDASHFRIDRGGRVYEYVGARHPQVWGREKGCTRDTNEAGEEANEPLVASAPCNGCTLLLSNNQPPRPGCHGHGTIPNDTPRPFRLCYRAGERTAGGGRGLVSILDSAARSMTRGSDDDVWRRHNKEQQLDGSIDSSQHPTHTPTHHTGPPERPRGDSRSQPDRSIDRPLDRPKPDVAFHRRPGPPGRRHDGACTNLLLADGLTP